MADVEYFIKGALWLSAGQVISTFIAGVTSIVLARLLGPDGYGLYSLSISTAGLLAVFSWFGVDQAAIRGASREGGAAGRILDVAVTFSVLNAVSLLVVGVLASRVLAYAVDRPWVSQAVAAASVSVASGVLFSSSGLLTAAGRPDVPAKAGVVLQLLRGFLVPGLALYLGFYGAVLGHSISYLLASAAVLGFYVRVMGGWRPSLEGLGGMLLFGVPLWLPSVLAMFVGFARAVVMGHVLSNGEIGEFSVAMNFVALMGVLVTPMSSMALPYISMANNSEEEALRHVVRVSAFLATPVAVFSMLYAAPLVELFYGKAYLGASGVLMILTLQYMLCLGGSVGLGQYLVAKGLNRAVLEASALGSLVQLAALYPLVLALRSQGVALAIVA
ncbi:MAG: oligosaccharide flippase family protein, partial [Infirmifilum sp.]